MTYSDVSKTFLTLESGLGPSRFWLDPRALARGHVHAPDGTSVQCPGCGTDLSTAEVRTSAHARKSVAVVCAGCASVFRVHTADEEF